MSSDEEPFHTPIMVVVSRCARCHGLARIFVVLKFPGRAVFWSADPVPDFTERLAGAGFAVNTVPARFHPLDERCAGTIYVADKPRVRMRQREQQRSARA